MIEFREGQKETILAIREAFKDHHIIILDAPVGSGKSLINLLSVEGYPTYLTTPRVDLVNQYREDITSKFQGLGRSVKGRSNYRCIYEEPHYENVWPHINAANAKCTWEETVTDESGETHLWQCPVIGDCPYYVERTMAQMHNTAITTLDYFMLGINRGRLNAPPDRSMDDPSIFIDQDIKPKWEKRQILVVDEAHGLPQSLVRFFSVDITKRTFGPYYNYDEMVDVAKELVDQESDISIGERIKDMFVSSLNSFAMEINDRIDNPNEAHNKPTFISLRDTIGKYLSKMSRIDMSSWVFEITKDSNKTKFSWTPLKIDEFMKETWESFDHIIFSSATFVSYSSFLHELGLDNDTFAIIRVPDTFPSSSAPIYIAKDLSMGYKTKETTMPIAMREIERLADRGKEYKGLIHCVSYDNQQYIENNASPELRQRLKTHTSENRNETLDKYREDVGDNSILLSVNMTEGLDLPNDTCRWQIILKTPFRSMGSEWVRQRMKLPDGRQWYETDALLHIMQASGRIMRSKDDWGVTYLLDGNAIRLIKMYEASLPEWFTSRISIYSIQ